MTTEPTGADFDVFVSYAHADAGWVAPLTEALQREGLEVWRDRERLEDFASITQGIRQGLQHAKALLACYSTTYPTRRACQWELTVAYLAASRHGDPRRRVLVVNPEPGSGHIDPVELRDALYGGVPGPDDPARGSAEGFADVARRVARRVRELSGAFGDVAPAVPPRWLPEQAPSSPRFVGRHADLWRVHSTLHAADPSLAAVTGMGGAPIAQIRGLGGIGKTALAAEYAWRFAPAYPGGIFWLRAYGSDDDPATRFSPEALAAQRNDQLLRIATGLGVLPEGRPDPETLPAAISRALEENGKPCLWVVDDLPSGLDEAAFRSWLAPHPLAATLITTRSHEYDELARVVPLDVLPDDDAYELLTARRKPGGEAEREAARALAVKELGGHAVAVTVAGAALAGLEGVQSFAEFRDELAKPATTPEEDALERLAAEQLKRHLVLPGDHSPSIARTLLRSIRKLSDDGADLLRLAAQLSAAPIPASLVPEVFAHADRLDAATARRRAARAIHQAESRSLLTRAAHDGTGQRRVPDPETPETAAPPADDARLVVHALVTRVTRSTETAPDRAATLRRAAIAALTARFKESAEDPRRHGRLHDLAPHARDLVKRIDADPATQSHLAPPVEPTQGLSQDVELMWWLARYDYERGDYRSAADLHRKLVTLTRDTYGNDHPATLAAIGNLANTLDQLGDLPTARTLQEERLAASRRLLGNDHPATLAAIGNLAATLDQLGDLPAARTLAEECLRGMRRVLGNDHPDTLQAIGNLAATLDQLGDLPAARTLAEECLRGMRRVLGDGHPHTAWARGVLEEIDRRQRGGEGPG